MADTWQVNADGMVTLEAERKSRVGFGCLAAFTLLWNGIIFSAVLSSVRSSGTPWYHYLFFAPFVLVGVALAVFLLLALFTGVLSFGKFMPAAVRVSRQPLRLGETFRVVVEQSVKSAATVDTMRCTLRAREWVEYSQGTKTYTDKHTLLEQPVTLFENAALAPGQPFGGECEFTIPAESMHTLDLKHNKIQWTLEVAVVIPRWPDYKARFPLVVAPHMVASAGGAA
ncbi:MAG: hypothetical protein JXA69_13915 [Phycisphaerae bacterium]|nr:hypothetical protein [Phycisphaerae bacterium]